ncbi:MAG: DNA mismatch repair protein MutS [Clostridium sp.]|nr:DNA mismatch repair protein MutS [Clostridium sp.]
MIFSERYYKNQISEKTEINKKLEGKIKIVGSIRLIVVIIALISSYISYRNDRSTLFIINILIMAALFLALVFYHDKLYMEKKRNGIIIDINEEGLKRINGEFKKFKDNGAEFLDEKHSFINDLDVFGDSSLFQFMNTTISKGGRLLLAKVLKREIKFNKEEILERQEAVQELSKKVSWRQQIIAEGRLQRSKDIDLERFIEWGNEEKSGSSSILRIIAAGIFVAVTWICILMSSIGILPMSFILLLLTVDYVAVKIIASPIEEDIKFFESIKENIAVYNSILTMIDEEEFNSSLLRGLSMKLKSNNLSCRKEMQKLNNIMAWLGDSSKNMAYMLINILFFSDIYIMKRLEKWRAQNGEELKNWMDVLHEIDALCSISNLPFEHEEWSYPVIYTENTIECIGISHPLIGKSAVKNNFSLQNKQKAALITGSNMSGKSTFLRTIGINLLLAYIGAPVSAEKLTCGIMDIYTCMRTKDNLEENISSFYAEILRIKLLIEACRRGEKVFFLLDEIFKGTNSKDRHIGATVLIKQLIEYGGSGLVSTHDLELCDLESETITNYNFSEFYEDDKIKFDYILRRGKSTTQNAIHLMKLAGIEI